MKRLNLIAFLIIMIGLVSCNDNSDSSNHSSDAVLDKYYQQPIEATAATTPSNFSEVKPDPDYIGRITKMSDEDLMSGLKSKINLVIGDLVDDTNCNIASVNGYTYWYVVFDEVRTGAESNCHYAIKIESKTFDFILAKKALMRKTDGKLYFKSFVPINKSVYDSFNEYKEIYF